MTITSQTQIKLPVGEWGKLFSLLVFTVGGAVAAGSWWMSTLQSDTDNNRKAIEKNQENISELALYMRDTSKSVAIIAKELEITNPVHWREFRAELRDWAISLREWIRGLCKKLGVELPPNFPLLEGR